jgi:hypothetical protein
LKICILTLFVAYCLQAQTTVLFQPSMTVGPFPTNALTTVNLAQKTGLQVNLPAPSGCNNVPTPSACANAAALNHLDGFSINPMITVCFSGPVNPSTLAGGLQIYPLTSFGPAIGIDQILWDPNFSEAPFPGSGYCMYAKPSQTLNEHSTYFLAITNSILDANGKPVIASSDFKNCINGGGVYCDVLSVASTVVGLIDDIDNPLVGASLFTTMSATDWVQKAQAFENLPTTPTALLPAGTPSVFTLSNVSSLTWFQQIVPNSATYNQESLPVGAPVLGGVEKIAFGLYLSPNFLNISGPLAGTITATPTNLPIAPPVSLNLPGIPNGFEPVSFHVFLPPAAKAPQGGFPVVIYGHGLGDDQFGAATYVASTLANNGFATLALEITGHGYGAGSFVQVTTTPGNGNPSVVPVPGRGILIPGNKTIGPTDGCIVPGPIAVRDCGRQTAVDLFALVRTIRATSGLGLNLNPAKIYYVGQSFGSIYGALFHAVEPSVRAAVLSVVGGTDAMVSRLSPIARSLAEFYLATNVPALLNVPPAPQEPYFHDPSNDLFNDNYVFRDSGPVTNTVAGAAPIQQAFEIAEWLDMSGDALAFAPNLITSPFNQPKPTLVQFAFGDLEVPNPTSSAFIRAGGLQRESWYYRFDTAAGLDPPLLGLMQPGVAYPIMPHRYLSNPTIFDTDKPGEHSVAMAAQQQVAAYFSSDGVANADPNSFLQGSFAGKTLFQLNPALPEDLNFLQIPRY